VARARTPRALALYAETLRGLLLAYPLVCDQSPYHPPLWVDLTRQNRKAIRVELDRVKALRRSGDPGVEPSGV